MGAAEVSDRTLSEMIDRKVSYETLRLIRKGERSLSQELAFYIDQAIGEVFRVEVGDVVEWLLSGYHDGPSRPLAGTRVMGP